MTGTGALTAGAVAYDIWAVSYLGLEIWKEVCCSASLHSSESSQVSAWRKLRQQAPAASEKPRLRCNVDFWFKLYKSAALT